MCWGPLCCLPATLSPALNQLSPEQGWEDRLVLRKCGIWIFRMGIVVMQMQAGLHVYIPEYVLQCMCEPNSDLPIWGLAVVSGWGLHLKSSVWGSHCVCSCKWYIIWYLNWNTFVLVAEEHTRWNSGINDVTGNFAICLWMAFCFFSSLGRSVSMFVTFCSVICKVGKKAEGKWLESRIFFFF